MVDYAYTAQAYFDASHRVEGYPGCNAPHGHTWRVRATVIGGLERDAQNIFRTNLSEDLQDELARICEELDERDLDAMVGVVSIPEVVAAWFLERLPDVDVVEVEMGWRKAQGTARRNKKR